MTSGEHFVTPGSESVRTVHFLLAAAASGGADAHQIARDARIPDWVLSSSEAMTSPHFSLRILELAEHMLEDPQLPLTFAAHCETGELGLYDYLFTTAPTLRDGFDLNSRYLYLRPTGKW